MAILNRKVSWRLELRADPRHPEEIVKGMGLSMGSKGIDGLGADVQGDDGDGKEMNPTDAKRDQGLVARAT